MTTPHHDPWDSGARPGDPRQLPPGFYFPPGTGPHQPPPSRNNGLKWLVIGVGVLLVVAIVIGAAVLSQVGSGDGAARGTSAPAISDVASADGTGPVEIITVEPTSTGQRLGVTGSLKTAS